jgi:antibiotic biosynthesis monooxygenase (ABM) superfamily enzyme
LLNLWPELRYTAVVALAVAAILALTIQVPALAQLHPAWRLLLQSLLVTAVFGLPLARMAREWLHRSRQTQD